MSFTSTLSVGTRAVLVLVVELFFSKSTSMENILQSIVKIIIIGIIITATNVKGNRQFLPPPLPYYQNDDYFLPAFVPPYHDPLPVYYREPNPSPHLSYQNMNPYPPQQLFHRNKNYNPAQFSSPNVGYPPPEVFEFKPSLRQSYGLGQKDDMDSSETDYKRGEVSPKKTAFYATNIIIKDESQPPYYQDEYNKNYHEDDYTDNYSDESPPPPPEPCLVTSPYRYFEPGKRSSKNTLCNPHFQPNFASDIYTVKMPITLLPSRFPPRVEQLIERIQNYFSTYTQLQTPKPQNVSYPSTTAQPVTETTAESVATPTILTTPTQTVDSQHKKNTTAEIEIVNLEETGSEATETTTVAATTPAVEEVTQKTIVVEIVEADGEENSQQSTPTQPAETNPIKSSSNEGETIRASSQNAQEAVAPVQVQEASQQISQEAVAPAQAEETGSGDRSSENQIPNEWSYNKTWYPMTEAQFSDLNASSATQMWSRTEENITLQPTNETLLDVTDKNG